MSDAVSAFDADYVEARREFIESARTAGARLDRLALEAKGPDGVGLSIDIAWLGAARPHRVVLHVSGTHGVEAFAGSAIQRVALKALPRPAAGCALIMVHVLNPWGMAWHRRVNENNVDLNRNFLHAGEAYAGAPALYGRLSGLLNPRRPRGLADLLLRAGPALLRHGWAECRDTIVQGQYVDPDGLFFGGKRLEQGPSLYVDWLRQALGGIDYLLAIDVHSGLGAYARELLFHTRSGYHYDADTLQNGLATTLRPVPESAGANYEVRGGHANIGRLCLPDVRMDFLTQEFGTYSMLRLLAVLRAENSAFQNRHPGVAQWQRRLLLALTPRENSWRRPVLAQGVARLQSALDWVADPRLSE